MSPRGKGRHANSASPVAIVAFLVWPPSTGARCLALLPVWSTTRCAIARKPDRRSASPTQQWGKWFDAVPGTQGFFTPPMSITAKVDDGVVPGCGPTPILVLRAPAEKLPQLLGRDRGPLPGCLLDQNRAAEILIAGVDGGRDGQGGEEAEQGPKLVLDHQRVTRSAARGREHDRLVAQRTRIDEVEQVLEQARVGTLVDRGSDDEGVGGFDRLDHAGRLRREVAARVGRAEAGTRIEQVVDRQVDVAPARKGGRHCLDEGTGSGGSFQVAGDADHTMKAHAGLQSERRERAGRSLGEVAGTVRVRG